MKHFSLGIPGMQLYSKHLNSFIQEVVLIHDQVLGWVWRAQQSQYDGVRVECCGGFSRNSHRTTSVSYSEGPVTARNTRQQINDCCYFKSLSLGGWL